MDIIYTITAFSKTMHISCVAGMPFHSFFINNIEPEEWWARTPIPIYDIERPTPIEYIACPKYKNYGDYMRFLMAYIKVNPYWYYAYSFGGIQYMRRICLKLI